MTAPQENPGTVRDDLSKDRTVLANERTYAAWRYSHLHVRMENLDVDALPLFAVRALSLVLAVCSLISLASLWYISD